MTVSLDFSALAQAIVNALMQGVQTLLGPIPLDFESWLLGILQSLLSTADGTNLLTQNPTAWITQDQDVQTLFHQGIAVQIALAMLVMAIQGIRIMGGRVELREALFKTIFCVLLGNGMLVIGGTILTIVNQGATFVMSSNVDVRQITGQTPPNALELGLLLIIAVFFACLAWLKGAVGVVFLKLLFVSAPYLITLSAMPLLEGIGQWWIEEFTTWALRPFLVALILRLGLGLAAREGGPIELLFAIVTFWLAYTMDGRLRRFSAGVWGTIGQLNLFRRAAASTAGVFFPAAAAGGAAAAATSAAAGAASAATGTP